MKMPDLPPTVTLPLWVVALLAVVLLFLVLILWSVKRRRRPSLDLEEEGGISELMPTIAGLTHGTLVEGNSASLVQNGQFFEQLFRDLKKARQTIDFETFLSKEGEVTRQLAAILCEKAREGVDVRLMLDASGGRRFGKKEVRAMEEAGVHQARYHPLRFSNLGRMNNRDHRKIVVIDGEVGWVGGHCLVDSWLGDAQDGKHFRDISVRLEGPVVAQIQAAFSENWIEETGEVPGGERFFPQPRKKGKAAAHVVYTTPHGSPSSVKLLHYLAIHAAHKRVWIQNPYFLPDPDARTEMVKAVKRGVDVRVMIPAPSASDSPVVQHASHHRYGFLLKGGVRIFEYQKTLLHQKVMTVDGCWSAVGSTNFDDRSFELNDEITVGIFDDGVAAELEKIFDDDCRDAEEIKLDEWKKRSIGHRMLDGFLFLFNEQL